MGIAPNTVRVHIRDMKIKFQIDTREQLFTYAQGIVKKLK
jgi:DNA-binding CsgD family transcriptional regulator